MPGWLHPFSMLLAAAWAGVIFLLSSQSGMDTPPLFPHADKVLHALAFGLLGFLVLGGLRPGKRGYRGVQLWSAVAITTGYGILDEIHQHFVPGRMPDVLDVLADLAGAMLGAGLLYVIVGRRHRGR